jgi:5,10-methylenetetrahydrofolate reductase
MKISYELNPPKIVINDHHFDVMRLNQELQILLNRSSELVNLVNGIHLTDSVLGIPRVSSITAASYIKKNTGGGRGSNNNRLKLSCSVRTRDRNFTSFCQFVTDAILVGVESLLILRGDEPASATATAPAGVVGEVGAGIGIVGGGGGRRREEEDGVGQKSSGLKPTSILSILNDKKYNKSIHLNLSVPSKIFYHNRSLFEKKIEAKPYSLVTQLISSLSDLGEIVDIAKSFKIKVVACVMVPSDKNRRSADIIGLDWKEYEKNPVDFIKAASTLADEVLISSPNSFRMGIDLLKSLRQ